MGARYDLIVSFCFVLTIFLVIYSARMVGEGVSVMSKLIKENQILPFQYRLWKHSHFIGWKLMLRSLEAFAETHITRAEDWVHTVLPLCSWVLTNDCRLVKRGRVAQHGNSPLGALNKVKQPGFHLSILPDSIDRHEKAIWNLGSPPPW